MIIILILSLLLYTIIGTGLTAVLSRFIHPSTEQDREYLFFFGLTWPFATLITIIYLTACVYIYLIGKLYKFLGGK